MPRPTFFDWAVLGVVLYFVISVGYALMLEWRGRGQTVGKRLFGLRVIDVHGLRLQSSQIVLRNLLRLIDALPVTSQGGVTALLIRTAGAPCRAPHRRANAAEGTFKLT